MRPETDRPVALVTGAGSGIGRATALRLCADGLVPSLWVVAVAVVIAQGRLEPGRPYLVALAGLVMLLWRWAGGRQASDRPARREPADSLSP